MPRSVNYKKGTIIFFEETLNTHIYILQSGAVVLKRHDENGKSTFSHVKKGDFFGVRSSLARMPTIESATALVDSTVIQMSVFEFRTAFGNKLNVTLTMLRSFCDELSKSYNKMTRYLGGRTSGVSMEEGMMEVAKSFYEAGHIKSCVSILFRILKLNPETEYREEIDHMMEDADKIQNVWIDTSSFRLPTREDDFYLPEKFDSHIRRFKRGDVLACEYEPANKYFIIISGDMLGLKCIAGHNKLLDVLGPGNFIGQTAIVSTQARTITYVARSEGECYEFTKEDTDAVLGSNAKLTTDMLGELNRRIYNQERQLETVSIRDVTARICDVLVMYDEISGDDSKEEFGEGSYMRRFYVTISEIANFADLPEARTQDVLKDLQAHRKLQVFDDCILVNNIFEIKRKVDAYYAAIRKNHG